MFGIEMFFEERFHPDAIPNLLTIDEINQYSSKGGYESKEIQRYEAIEYKAITSLTTTNGDEENVFSKSY